MASNPALKEAEPNISVLAAEAPEIPSPCGYKILVAVPNPDEKTAGGVYVPQQLLEREHRAAIVGMVVKLGPDAYTDLDRFPTGAYCKTGDWVVFRPYSGMDFVHANVTYRFTDDDAILGVVDDPRSIVRR